MNAHAATTLKIQHTAHAPRSSRLSGIEMAALALATITLMVCAAFSVRPSATPEVDSTITVKIAPSDTLWDLARAYPVDGLTTAQTVAVIRDLNDMSTSAIVAGETLEVPASSSISAAVASR
ncbi:MAG: LysM peptidoglycan-binding domain-containing protein [Coriobacteriia bacterium]